MCYPLGMFGFLNVRKPAGPTSHDVVSQVRDMLPGPFWRRPKVGHAGTLDPLADGVLVICLGQATRLAEYVHRGCKRYEAEITLGATSTTDDYEGQVTQVVGVQSPSLADIRRVLDTFEGTLGQVPPAHSAVNVAGRRAYELARAGSAPLLEPRQVEIHSLEVLEYAWPSLGVDVRCGAGTYIRALARDVGAALGVGGFCSSLRRTEVGPFKLADSIELDRLDIQRDLLSPLAALAGMASVAVSDEQAALICRGHPVEVGQDLPTEELSVVDRSGKLLAVAVASGPRERTLRPVKVFAGR